MPKKRTGQQKQSGWLGIFGVLFLGLMIWLFDRRGAGGTPSRYAEPSGAAAVSGNTASAVTAKSAAGGAATVARSGTSSDARAGKPDCATTAKQDTKSEDQAASESGGEPASDTTGATQASESAKPDSESASVRESALRSNKSRAQSGASSVSQSGKAGSGATRRVRAGGNAVGFGPPADGTGATNLGLAGTREPKPLASGSSQSAVNATATTSASTGFGQSPVRGTGATADLFVPGADAARSASSVGKASAPSSADASGGAGTSGTAAVTAAAGLAVAGAASAGLSGAAQAPLGVASPDAEARTTGKGRDDLTRIIGVGPKVADVLKGSGVSSYQALAVSSVSDLQSALEKAGNRFAMADPTNWPAQAALAASGEWDELAQKYGSGAGASARGKSKTDLAHEGDDLTRIEGIGPKIAALLSAAKVNSFRGLAETDQDRLQQVLQAGGSNFAGAVPDTWPEQAELAAMGQWAALDKLQDSLEGGKRR